MFSTLQFLEQTWKIVIALRCLHWYWMDRED